MFKKSRSRSPSFEMSKLCLPKLPRQKRSTSMDSSPVAMSSGLDVPLENRVRSSSLDVPLENRVRSSSFDCSSLTEVSIDLLQVPTKGRGGGSHRSHSFDTAVHWTPVSSDDNGSDKETSTSLKVPKYQKRRASLDIPKICMHCVHLEALEQERERARKNALFYLGDTQMSSPDTSPSESLSDSDRSFSSDSEGSSPREVEIEIIETPHSNAPSPQRSSHASSKTNSYTDVVTLAVPVMKQRSSSLDAGYITKPPESPRKASLDERTLHKAHAQMRSQSLDTAGPSNLREQSLAWLASIQQTFK